MLDGDVDEPGTQRPLLLVCCFLGALHGCLSPFVQWVGRCQLKVASSRVAASRASEITADSKLRLWHVGRFMSPSSVCAATRQPPRTHGDKGAVAAFLPGLSGSNCVAAWFAHASLRPSMWPVDCALLAGEAGAGVERPVGADGVRVRRVNWQGPMCTPSASGTLALRSPRAGTTSCRRGSGTSRTADAGRRRRPTSCRCRRAACRRARPA